MSTHDEERLDAYVNDGLTVGELKAALDAFDDDARVVFTYQYGDHWRTIVAERVSDVAAGRVKWSAYHSMPKQDDESEDGCTVIILS
jgi:hypothetical protein